MKNFWKKWATKASQVAPLIAYGNVGQPVWTPRRYDTLAQEGYMLNPIVFSCVHLVAKGAASVPWKLFHKGQEMAHHPLLDVLHHPNPNYGGAAFIKSVMAYYLLSGNSYIEAVCDHQGVIRELHTLRPDRVRVIPSAHGVPAGYEYSVGERSRIIPNTSAPCILHLKTFHPLNDWYGMSPIEAASRAIDQNNAVSSHNLSILQNGGRPTGALKIKPRESRQPLSDEQREILRQDIRASYEGSLNAGKIMVLEGEFEWQEMGLSPKDLDFIEGKKLSSREIAQTFGVPPMLAGIPGDATFANYREARYHLWEDTIVPLLDMLCDELNHWLVPRYGTDLRLAFDLEAIPALALKRENMWKRMDACNFLTINEKRKAMGYQPLERGDQLGMGV